MAELKCVLEGITELTQDILEKELLDIKIDPYFREKSEDGQELFFDLSKVKWANIGAAFQLCLVIEKLKKNNYKVYVALPLLRDKDNLIIKESKVNKYLKVLGFDKAVLCKKTEGPSVELTESYEFKESDGNTEDKIKKIKEAFKRTYIHLDFEYKHIVPFQWIKSEKSEKSDLNKLHGMIENFLKDKKQGIEASIDVDTLKNVVLSELLKNLDEHAGDDTKYALFSMGLISSKSITSVSQNILEKDYLKGIENNNINSAIEIYFGDTGESICSYEFLEKYKEHSNEKSLQLDKDETHKKLIKWSFDKWSTKKDEKIRATKGLYRLHRIVNKYNGIVHIRAKKADGGFQKGGKLESEWIVNKEKLYSHPGTFVQVKLCPHREVTEYKVKVNEKDKGYKSNKEWKVYYYPIKEENIDTNEFLDELRAKLCQNDFDNLIIVFYWDENLDVKALKEGNFVVDFREKFEEILLRVSELRGNKGIIFYLAMNNIGKDVIDGSVDSANKMIIKETNGNIETSTNLESLSPDFEKIYDPVLVIGKDNSIFWCGGNQSIIELLNDIYEENDEENKKITNLESFNKLSKNQQIEIRKFLQNESSFFKIACDDEIYFDFTNILKLSKDNLEKCKKINTLYDGCKVCSPKLDIRECWIDFEKVLDKESSKLYALGLYIQLLANHENMGKIHKTSIFIDHSQQYTLAKELAHLIGIKDNKIINLVNDLDSELPKRTKLFNENDNVIILTTVIASSETIRRLVKQIFRDKANALCVLCLIDERNEPNKVVTWDQDTAIHSLIEKRKEENEKKIYENEEKIYHKKKDEQIEDLSKSLENEKDLIIYSPKYTRYDNDDLNKDFQYDLPEKLKILFKETKSLHYEHFGKFNGRHFSFFLDKEKILHNESISKDINNKIKEWIKDKEEYNIVLPDSNFESLKKCLTLFESKINYEDKNIKELNSLIDGKKQLTNVIFFDFGSLTGSTINNIMTSDCCKDNLLIITIFSQFKNGEKKLYNKIKVISSEFKEDEQVAFKEDKKTGQLSLPLETTDDSADKKEIKEKEKKLVNVTYDYLYELPIHFYQHTHCHICQHIEALDKYMLRKSEYIKKFAEDRKLKLKIKDSNHIPEIPEDPYGEEMSSELIASMYYFKRILEYSFTNTISRIRLFKDIYSISKNKDDLIKNPDSKLYALIYLLSYELLWLHKEPLVFRIFRHLIYSLSKYVSTFNINELICYFSKDKDEVTALKLATRYKFAAISVFRSSNKYYFCQNILNILESSVIEKEKRRGDNIFQNTLYHTNSIHVNRHNKSEKYFKHIESQLTSILSNNEILLTEEQKKTVKLVQFNNEIYRKEIELQNMTQVELFRELKKNVLEIYDPEIPNHSNLVDCFNKIKIDDSIETLNYALNNKNDIIHDTTEKYKYTLEKFENIRDSLDENYYPIQAFIRKIEFYIGYFHNFKENIFLASDIPFNNSYKECLSIIDEFKSFISKGKIDYWFLIDNSHLYVKYWKLIDRTFIQNDNQLLNLLYSIPANLKNTVNTVFLDADFNKSKIMIDENINVFFCERLLAYHFELILNNIKKRQNENYPEGNNDYNNLSNCEITITAEKIEDNKIKFIIKYSNTDKFRGNENSKGSLSKFKKELNNFGGSLSHGLYNKDYLIKIELKEYRS